MYFHRWLGFKILTLIVFFLLFSSRPNNNSVHNKIRKSIRIMDTDLLMTLHVLRRPKTDSRTLSVSWTNSKPSPLSVCFTNRAFPSTDNYRIDGEIGTRWIVHGRGFGQRQFFSDVSSTSDVLADLSPCACTTRESAPKRFNVSTVIFHIAPGPDHASPRKSKAGRTPNEQNCVRRFCLSQLKTIRFGPTARQKSKTVLSNLVTNMPRRSHCRYFVVFVCRYRKEWKTKKNVGSSLK